MHRNFKYLDDLIHSNSKDISLTYDILLDNEEALNYIDGIKLDVDDVVIEGNYHIVDARLLTRIFSITGKNIIIKNILFKNGYSSSKLDNNQDGWAFRNPILPTGYAGAILNYGSVKLIDCTFIKNYFLSYGGAIVNLGDLEIKDCVFENNSSYNGGSIFNKGNVKIINCFFRYNGGPIYFRLKFELPHIYPESTKYGGAILNEYKLNMDNCRFRENYARHGGAINNYFGQIKGENLEFSDNSSRFFCFI